MKQVTLHYAKAVSHLYLGEHIVLAALEKIFKDHATEHAIFVVSQNLTTPYAELIAKISQLSPVCKNPVIVFEDSEKNKNWLGLMSLYKQMYRSVQRKTLVIGLGGGVLGDTLGFASATLLRGLPFVFIPTTLLAQVDASIGGKNGINFESVKNYIGTTQQPLATIVDPYFLTSLPPREINSGFVEMVKHGLIYDASYWQKLLAYYPPMLEKLPSDTWVELIDRSLEIKLHFVLADEKEQNIRAILNFGHSIGHYLEALHRFETYRHGECVLVGMHFAAYCSYQTQHLSQKEWQEIHLYLQKFSISIPIKHLTEENFVQFVSLDKKMSGGNLKFILLEKIGSAFIQPTPVSALYQHLKDYQKQSQALISK